VRPVEEGGAVDEEDAGVRMEREKKGEQASRSGAGRGDLVCPAPSSLLPRPPHRLPAMPASSPAPASSPPLLDTAATGTAPAARLCVRRPRRAAASVPGPSGGGGWRYVDGGGGGAAATQLPTGGPLASTPPAAALRGAAACTARAGPGVDGKPMGLAAADARAPPLLVTTARLIVVATAEARARRIGRQG
jgi:hypothetical protein